MKIYLYRHFAKWRKTKDISNEMLKKAIQEIESGLFDADLGEGLYKKRMAKIGKGKRNGYRILIAFKQEDKAIFIFGFEKSEKDNVTEKELFMFKILAQKYYYADQNMIEDALKIGELVEVII